MESYEKQSDKYRWIGTRCVHDSGSIPLDPDLCRPNPALDGKATHSCGEVKFGRCPLVLSRGVEAFPESEAMAISFRDLIGDNVRQRL